MRTPTAMEAMHEARTARDCARNALIDELLKTASLSPVIEALLLAEIRASLALQRAAREAA